MKNDFCEGFEFETECPFKIHNGQIFDIDEKLSNLCNYKFGIK